MTFRTGIYLHWPYCQKICPYCDFNVTRARDVDVDHWRRVLFEDLQFWADRVGRREIVSLYFGGGTPSLMPATLVADVIDHVAKLFDLQTDAELTLEANPTDVEMDAFESLAKAGINRLSLGVQSFEDTHLAFLGRNHDGLQARLAYDKARTLFPKLTFDLIYGLPNETELGWGKRLAEVLADEPQHLSLYQLTIEPDTAFHNAVARGDWSPFSPEALADLYEETQQLTVNAGLPAYEVSNHARPGQRAVHNSLYWQGMDWIGIGPGAHGRLTLSPRRLATEGIRQIGQYLTGPVSSRYTEENLTPEAIAIERIAGGLRPVEGMPITDLSEDQRRKIADARTLLVHEGYLADEPDRLRVLQKGRLLIDQLAAQLIQSL